MIAPSRALAAAVALAFSGLVPACYFAGGPAGQAQIHIKGHPLWQIRATAEDVFYRHGFSVASSGLDRIVFERRGRALDNILYGNWEGPDTTSRVTVYFIEKSGGSCLVRAASKVVRNADSPFEDDGAFPDLQGAKYQGLLNKIKRELGPAP